MSLVRPCRRPRPADPSMAEVPPHESTRGAPGPPAARSSDPGMEPSEDPSLSTPLVGIWVPRLSGRTRPRCFGGPFVFTSTNLSPQASSLNVKEFQDLWPCLSLVIEQGPTGDNQSPEGNEAQLWSTCLCLESLASFVLLRPGEYWAILQQYGLLPSHGSCLWNSGEAGLGTGAGHCCVWLLVAGKASLQRLLGLQCYWSDLLRQSFFLNTKDRPGLWSCWLSLTPGWGGDIYLFIYNFMYQPRAEERFYEHS